MIPVVGMRIRTFETPSVNKLFLLMATGRLNPEMCPEKRLTEFLIMASFMPTAREARRIRVDTAVKTIRMRTDVDRRDLTRKSPAVLIQKKKGINLSVFQYQKENGLPLSGLK